MYRNGFVRETWSAFGEREIFFGASFVCSSVKGKKRVARLSDICHLRVIANGQSEKIPIAYVAARDGSALTFFNAHTANRKANPEHR